MVQIAHLYVTIEKTITFTVDLCWHSDVSAFECEYAV